LDIANSTIATNEQLQAISNEGYRQRESSRTHNPAVSIAWRHAERAGCGAQSNPKKNSSLQEQFVSRSNTLQARRSGAP
jgi:hypothetical protein